MDANGRSAGALVAAVRDLDDTHAARELLELNPYEESAYLLLLDAEVAAGRPLAATKSAMSPTTFELGVTLGMSPNRRLTSA